MYHLYNAIKLQYQPKREKLERKQLMSRLKYIKRVRSKKDDAKASTKKLMLQILALI